VRFASPLEPAGTIEEIRLKDGDASMILPCGPLQFTSFAACCATAYLKDKADEARYGGHADD